MTDKEKLCALLKGAQNRRITVLDEIDSTNRYLLDSVRAGESDVGDVVIAECQTAGRGRLGKSFSSPKGGIYVSFCVNNTENGLTTVICGIAVARALEAIGLVPKIKWVNDVLLDGKKVAGILAQSVGDGKRAVVGVGIDLRYDAIPKDLLDIATAVDAFPHEPYSPEDIIADTVNSFEELSRNVLRGKNIINEYEKRLCHMGEYVTVMNDMTVARTVGVADDGSLKVLLPDGRIRFLSSGEISIRPKNY